MKMKLSTHFTKIDAVRIFVALLLILIILGMFLRRPFELLIYRTKPELITMAFWSALYQNDMMALELVDAAHRGFINNWIVNHKAISCGDSLAGGPTSIGHWENDGYWHASVWHSCISQTGRPYCLAIDGIIVEKTNEGWLVVGWNKITNTCE